MKCYACYSEVEEEAVICPVCGFNLPRRIGNKELYDQIMEKAAAKYRETHMIAAKIGLMAYYYLENENGELIRKEKEIVLCEDVSSISLGEIVWNPQNFGVLDPGTQIKLDVFRELKGNTKFWEVELTAPETIDFWRVGIRSEGGLKFHILLGNEKHYSESEAISLIG